MLENLRHVMESTYICNRYFLYAALKNADVQLSWIRERDGKLLAPSAYIRLICEATGVSVIPAKRDTITMHQIQETVTGQGRILAYNVRRMPESTAMEARMDYAICPMKYALGYILEKAPVFQSEFHNNYVINGLIAALFSLMKARDLSVDEIYRQTMEMFPFMRNVEKRQIYDYLEMQSSFKDVDYYGTAQAAAFAYTDERLKVRFPNLNVRNQALQAEQRLNIPNGRQGMDLYTPLLNRNRRKSAYRKRI